MTQQSVNYSLLDHPVDILVLLEFKSLKVIDLNSAGKRELQNQIGEDRVLTDFYGLEINEDSVKNWFSDQTVFHDERKRILIQKIVYKGMDQILLRHTPDPIGDIEQEKAKFEQIFEASSDAIFIFKSGELIEFNQRASKLFGYDNKDMQSCLPQELCDAIAGKVDKTSSFLARQVSEALGGQRSDFYKNCSRKNGEEFHAQFHLIPFVVENASYLQVVVKDISERVIFEQSIRESEERFKLLSNVAIESICFVDDNSIIDCNDQFAKLLDYHSRDEVIGKDITEFIRTTDINRLYTSGRGALKTEIRAYTKNDKMKYLEASASNIQYHDRKVIVVLFYDITNRKRTEQALFQSIDLYKSLIENSPNGVYILIDNKVEYTNNKGLTLLGFDDEDDVYGTNFIEFVSDRFKDEVEDNLQSVREGEEVDYSEISLQDREGFQIEVGIKATLTVFEGKPSIQVTITNLSTRKQLMQEQVRANIAEELNTILRHEIEEHKKTQQKLQEAQNFVRDIIESSIDMIIAIDENDIITEFNTAAQRLFGYKLDEVLGKKASMLYRRKSDFDKVKKELDKNASFSGEIVNKKKSGEMFTSFLSASLIQNQEGEILGSMGVSRDITELKKAEEELRASEERYRDIFENATDFILSIDKKGKLIYFNNAFLHALGYTEKEMEKLTIFDIADDPRVETSKDLFNVFVSDDLETIFVAKNGDQILVEGDTSIRYKGGKPHAIRAILRDVTEAKINQQAAIQQQAKLESIFNSTENMMMWTLNREHVITSTNINFVKHMKELFDKSLNFGKPFITIIKKLVNKDLYQGQLDAIKKAFKGKPQQFELPLLDKDGNNVWLQFFLNPVYLEGNDFDEISCLAYDITERKEIDRKIRDSLKEKEVLLQEVHHRVKNNLQVISSILNLQSSYVKDQNTLDILKESQNRIKSMSFIHESLYQTTDFSSIEFTQYIETISRNLIHSYSYTTGPVELDTDFDTIYLSIDQAIPCGLIVNELVSNALKYAFPEADESRDNTIKLHVKQNKRTISLLVADNGVGLPEDFKHEESDSLGIQLVYTLSEQLDAKLEVGNDTGTSFLITFEQLEKK
ncbi:PAS domain S-box protein [Halocola ammonii]